MKQIYFLFSISIFSLSFGQVVNPISATTTFTPAYGTVLTTCFAGDGLDTFPSVTSNHQGTIATNSFVANETTGNIDFNLGGTFNIDGIAFWNQNAGGPSPTVGVNGVNFYSSIDGVTYTLIPGAPTTFAQVTVQPAAPQTFTFTAVSAAYIRMTVLSNHAGGGGTGFAEIAFATGGILATDSFITNKTIAIYPNPTSDFIQISDSIATEKYSVYNNLGQEVKNGMVYENEKIDIRNLTNGVYFLKLDSANPVKFIKI